MADLGFERETHVAVLIASHKIEQLRERGDACPIHGLLLRELRGIAATRPDASDIQALHLRPVHVVDVPRRPWFQPASLIIAGDVRVERPVVVQHQHAVTGDRDVGLERGRPLGKGQLEGSLSVLGPVPARTSMTLQVECLRPGGCHQHRRDPGRAPDLRDAACRNPA